MQSNQTILEVRNLSTHFQTKSGVAKAVNGVSFSVRRGQTLGIVGESGSGKSMTMMSIVRLVPQPAGRIVGGEILFEGTDLLALSESEMRAVRGARIAVVTQDPMSSLNPVYNIENQLREPLVHHQGLRNRGELHRRVLAGLDAVGIANPESRVRNYPHQFSGGQRQRIVTAMAIACQPSLLIADEPTTALDVTIQAQILRVLKEVQDRLQSAMIVVSHDLSVVARVCDVIAVMYAGRIVEEASVVDIFESPGHPYTRALIRGALGEVDAEGRLYAIPGQSPDVRNLPEGCPFAARCPEVRDRCRVEYPPRIELGEGHAVSCWAVAGEPGPEASR